jgi:hypothetical protein
MHRLEVIRRVMQQPLVPVLGMLAGAGAAKVGFGAWVAGGLLTLLSVHLAVMAIVMVARMRRHPA